VFECRRYKSTAAKLASTNAGTLPPALAFFHIPIDEYLKVYSVDQADGSACQGRKQEDICCSSVNTGVFQAFKDVGDVTATFVGHDHDNDFGFSYQGIYMYYGRKSGYGGYGPPVGWQRGSRVSLLKEGTRGLAEAWIRQEDGSKMVLSDCARIGSQSTCCGASATEILPNQKNTSVVDVPVSDLVSFQKGFDKLYREEKPNKCAIYEAAFRASIVPTAVADNHAKVERPSMH
jgi:hypothetical protein